MFGEVLGANVDAALVLKVSELVDSDVFRVYYERAMGIMHIKVEDIRDSLGRDLLSSTDIFERTGDKVRTNFHQGVKYAKDNLIYDRIQSENIAIQELSNSGFNIKKIQGLRYSNMPRRLVIKTLSANPGLRKIDFENKLSLGSLIRFKVSRGEVTRPFDADYKWVTNWVFKDQEVIPDFIDRSVTPFRAFNPDIEEVFIKYGFHLDKDSFRLTGIRILSRLKQDAFWRSDITDETIVELLANTSAIFDVFAIEHVLIAIGARQDLAAKVAQELRSKSDYLVAKLGLKGISIAGAMLIEVDNSLESHNRVVLPMTYKSGFLVSVLKLLAFQISILRGLRTGVFRKISVEKKNRFSYSNSLAQLGISGRALDFQIVSDLK
jgi:hypothetical protein